MPIINTSSNISLISLSNAVVNLKTQKEYDELMDIYTKAGWEWNGGGKPKGSHTWTGYKEETCLEVKDSFCVGSSDFFGGSMVISFEEFKRKQGLTPTFRKRVVRGNSTEDDLKLRIREHEKNVKKRYLPYSREGRAKLTSLSGLEEHLRWQTSTKKEKMYNNVGVLWGLKEALKIFIKAKE